MKKNKKSVKTNSDWLTGLTDIEMESTAGGLLTGDDLNGWLTDYQNGTFKQLNFLIKLQKEYKSKDWNLDTGIISLWFVTLSKDDKKTVVTAIAGAVIDYMKKSLKLS